MKLYRFCLLVLPLLVLLLLAPSAYADSLGAVLSTFAVLGAKSVTNASSGGSAATIINGNLGVSPGSSITGFPPGIVNGTIQPGTEATAQGQLTSAYNSLAGQAVTKSISAGGLNGATLTPGVYDVTSTTFDLTGKLTLDATGNPNGSWVFIMSSSLITGSDAAVDLSGFGAGNSVDWIVPSSATLGDSTDFAGNILAGDQIAFDPGAQDLCGRALAQTALVSFAGADPTTGVPNEVGGGCLSSGGLNGGSVPAAAPEPGTLLLLGSGIIGLAAWMRRPRTRARSAKILC